MSDYCRENLMPNIFSSDSWIILSPIEQSIKSKVEKVGKPLKNWDIQINYGIKTGFNEAFIIDGKTKDTLIEKSPKNAELIRPILRGRDIKRYKADFADLWIINSHNGYGNIPAVNIEDYPDIKVHLDCYIADLQKRKDKGITPYNLRSCIYMEDFSKQKIVYPNMTKFMPFFLDIDGYMVNQKCFIITGNNIGFLSAFFNSSLFKFCFKDNFPELFGDTRELSKIFFDKIPVIEINTQMDSKFRDLVLEIQKLKQCNKSTKHIEIQIDEMIFDLYGLSINERKTIGFIELQ